MTELVIFTDLDGTLLDAQNYSAEAAIPTLHRVVKLGVPIVFCSSRTYVEQVHLRSELGVPDPFIVENGAAIYVPMNTFGPNTIAKVCRDEFAAVEMGINAKVIRDRLNNVRSTTNLKFTSFGDLSVTEVVEFSNLSPTDAKRATMRDFSEAVVPFFETDRLPEFEEAATAHGLSSLYGGRFITLTELGINKGRAVRMLIGAYRRRFGDVVAIGIGDSPNDEAFFSAVDASFVVQQPDGAWPDIDVPNLKRIDGVGPHGWVAAVKEVMGL